MKKYFLIVFLFILAGCSSYRDLQNNNIKDLLNNSSDISSIKKLKVKDSSKEYLLFMQEISRTYFIKSQFEESIDFAKKSLSYYNFLDDRASINISSASSSLLASSLGSDNSFYYSGSNYERTLTYFYSAMSYLGQNDIERAMIDLRASANIQKLVTAKMENKTAKKEKDSLSKYQYSSEINKILKEGDSLSEFKGSFLNAYVYYISGNIRELYGDLNGAMVDYKLALSIYPNNIYIQQDALRIAKFIDQSYYQSLKSGVKETLDYNNMASALVVYEQGFVPTLEELEGVFWLSNGKLYNISLPFYPSKQVKDHIVEIEAFDNNKSLTNQKMQRISDIGLIAKYDLSQRFPLILGRQVSRIVSKSIVQNSGMKYSNDNNPIGLALYTIGTVSSIVERADTRSFRTLPSIIQVAKINTSEDIIDLKIKVDSYKGVEFDNINVKKGEIAVVYVIDTGKHIYQKVIYKVKKNSL